MAATAAAPNPTVDAHWQKASAKYDSRRAEVLRDVEGRIRNGPFRADWQSLATYEAPACYRDAKFGIFIHWGVYAVPAFSSEWYPRLMYLEGSPENRHQVATYGPLTSFGYKDFIPMFHAEHFDPQAWAALFKASGARDMVPVFEHHDGFTMYDSGLSDWTAVKIALLGSSASFTFLQRTACTSRCPQGCPASTRCASSALRVACGLHLSSKNGSMKYGKGNLMATKEFRCANVGYSECDWHLQGDSADEMVPKIQEHAAAVHHLELKEEAIEHVRNAIRDAPQA